MNILWSANAVWCTTGYGVEGKYILPRLSRAGHNVFNFAWYGLEGGRVSVMVDGEPVLVLPKGHHPFGADMLDFYCREYDIDLVVSLHDIWVLDETYKAQIPCKWACWFPVDYDPCPSSVTEIAQTCDYPMTYSRWGADVAARDGIPNIRYMPLGVAGDTFTPGDKAAARRSMEVPEDAFMISMVAANKGYPSRKSIPEALEAFTLFAQRHDNALLYMHCDYLPWDKGIDIPKLVASLGIAGRVRYANRRLYQLGFGDEFVADVYRASDLLLEPSMSEGFGLPIVEAQLCGTPVVTNACSSMPELTINGVSVEPAGRDWVPHLMNSWRWRASVDNVLAGMEEVYGWNAETKREMARVGREHMLARYDWDVIIRDYWQPFIAEVEGELVTTPA